ncbi:MAG: four helix bundle protein [Anaerolineales bacterium]
MRDFRKLKVWEKAHVLALDVYRNTQNFPRSEMFGLQAQMRRASVSVAANIAEGSGRSGRRELLQFLNLALGSASELQYHLLLARDLGLIGGHPHQVMGQRVVEVKRMLTGLSRRVRAEHQREARLKTDD